MAIAEIDVHYSDCIVATTAIASIHAAINWSNRAHAARNRCLLIAALLAALLWSYGPPDSGRGQLRLRIVKKRSSEDVASISLQNYVYLPEKIARGGSSDDGRLFIEKTQGFLAGRSYGAICGQKSRPGSEKAPVVLIFSPGEGNSDAAADCSLETLLQRLDAEPGPSIRLTLVQESGTNRAGSLRSLLDHALVRPLRAPQTVALVSKADADFLRKFVYPDTVRFVVQPAIEGRNSGNWTSWFIFPIFRTSSCFWLALQLYLHGCWFGSLMEAYYRTATSIWAQHKDPRRTITVAGTRYLVHKRGFGNKGAFGAVCLVSAPVSLPNLLLLRKPDAGLKRVIKEVRFDGGGDENSEENRAAAETAEFEPMDSNSIAAQLVKNGNASANADELSINYFLRAMHALERARALLQLQQAYRDSFQNEIAVLKSLQSSKCAKFVVQLIASEIETVNAGAGVGRIVMEAGRCDLLQFIQTGGRRGTKFTYYDLQTVWNEMLMAVNALRRERIVHFDLKPANFIIVQGLSPDSPPKLKLIDFGCARSVEQIRANAASPTPTGYGGTPGFMSPEVLLDEFDLIGPAVDVWAVGAIMHWILFGESPLGGGRRRGGRGGDDEEDEVSLAAAYVGPLKASRTERRGYDGRIMQKFTSQMELCLSRDPADRPRNLLRLHVQF